METNAFHLCTFRTLILLIYAPRALFGKILTRMRCFLREVIFGSIVPKFCINFNKLPLRKIELKANFAA